MSIKKISIPALKRMVKGRLNEEVWNELCSGDYIVIDEVNVASVVQDMIDLGLKFDDAFNRNVFVRVFKRKDVGRFYSKRNWFYSKKNTGISVDKRTVYKIYEIK